MSSIGDDIDIISTLPDAVICHILSFLQTKQSVATSVLSKRWFDLWRSVPVLKFKYVELFDRETYFLFNEFVYSVLLSRNSIKSCFLDIWYDDPDLARQGIPNVIKWINYVVQHGVELLQIYIGAVNFIPKFPIGILSCRTLVVLQFEELVVKGFSSITLPSLKSLRFNDIKFTNVQDLLLLLAGCPILEDLRASYLLFDSEDTLTYQERESLSLNKLTKANLGYTFCHFPLKALQTVEHLFIEINKVYRGCDEIPTFHNLTNLGLYSINYNWHLLVNVLKHCPNLQIVVLSQGTANGGIQDVVENNWVDPIFVPQCLSLQLRTCKLLNFLGQEGELLFAKYILKNARVLQTMKIHCSEDLKIERELFSCPRASTICDVIIKSVCK
ncbi:F-box/FBD/LRR-repeat protein At4g00160-like [Trifolium pratense]|uniref:Uncharacterized protein n=1 Tax=Trifolium pratense TaxID=57577 RepID=A0ACB0JH33_TRIPR|nr:F-box/FBD/LRR-repeat protein At4g00160-like [Trifolium pratense]CAJ2643565.1 unnamed protein product [Trifolium pratense]